MAGSNLDANDWGILILPYLDQAPLYNQYNCSVPPFNEAGALGFNSAVAKQNIAAISTKLPVFKCPSAPDNGIYQGALPANSAGAGVPPLTLTWSCAPSDYCVSTGVRGTFANLAYASYGGAGGDREGALQAGGLFGSGTCRFQDITDGSSNTYLIGERTGGSVIYHQMLAVSSPFGPVNGGGWGDFLNGEHWLQGALYDGNQGPGGGPCPINCSNLRGDGFHCFHTGGCHFLMGDGSIRFVSANVNGYTMAGLITRKKAEIIGDF
jgi:hypothetical protein